MDLFYELVMRLPRLGRMANELERLRPAGRFVSPGHFYSPLVDPGEAARDAARLYGPPPRTIAGVDLREDAQLALLEQLRPLYADLPFTAQPQQGWRYHYENPAYSYSDAIFLHLLMRHLHPKRVVEVGSGYSSCVMLDTDENFMGRDTRFTFVEPYPKLLHSLLREDDRQRVTVLPQRLQDVPQDVFTALEPGDFLFIDSSHVSKHGSDVNRLFFDVLPALRPGVYVHVHDIFIPFEYPREWIDEGRSWNEAYLLRAFLQFNDSFEIVLMNTYLEHFHEKWFARHMPLCLKNRGGSIWLRRTR